MHLFRSSGAARVRDVIRTLFNTPLQRFLDFVLSHYVSVGVDELDPEKLIPIPPKFVFQLGGLPQFLHTSILHRKCFNTKP